MVDRVVINGRYNKINLFTEKCAKQCNMFWTSIKLKFMEMRVSSSNYLIIQYNNTV